MISQKRHFFYQPSPLGSIICWSWTFIIFFVGVIFLAGNNTFSMDHTVFLYLFLPLLLGQKFIFETLKSIIIN
ncbi:EbsA family protein [Lentilactobacillus kisonensis]|uniref:EbsA family protein n=1 Tax=Lentilactobacillus kisonensis TaxID=481722 RepID=UPI000B25CE28